MNCFAQLFKLLATAHCETKYTAGEKKKWFGKRYNSNAPLMSMKWVAPPEDELCLEQKRGVPLFVIQPETVNVCVADQLAVSAYVCHFWGSTWAYYWSFSSFQLNCPWNEVRTNVYLHEKPWWIDWLICLEVLTVLCFLSIHSFNTNEHNLTCVEQLQIFPHSN